MSGPPTDAGGVSTEAARPKSSGLTVRPLRATRPTATGTQLASMLCPPYDVIGPQARAGLLATDPENFVAVALPEPTPEGYAHAADLLADRLARGVLAVDDRESLYVYDMRTTDGHVTRALVCAVQLSAPADGVILPHENTMAGPVADRLALMTATDADLEPIYLMYEGNGTVAEVLESVTAGPEIAATTTPDGVAHRLWALQDGDAVAAIVAELATRSAVIADGHHRYATYLERQRLRGAASGPGPWDYGLTLLVDTSLSGPQVNPIHRVVHGLRLTQAADMARRHADVTPLDDIDLSGDSDEWLTEALPGGDAFSAVVTDGDSAVLVVDTGGGLRRLARRSHEIAALSELDVSVLHHGLIEAAWNVPDDVEHVGYAHSIRDAIDSAREVEGVAVLVRATPARSVVDVALAGGRMPRKSTLFMPKPASGLFLRRLGDQPATP